MNKSDTTIFNSLRGFINEIKNKRRTDIKQVKKAYVTGFVIKQVKENHYKLFWKTMANILCQVRSKLWKLNYTV